MRILILAIIFTLLSSLAFATDFQLEKVEERESYTFIELSYGIDGELQSFSEIISPITITQKLLYVRLLGEFSEETNSELLTYYEKNIPNELNKALVSSGNLHNPSLELLIDNFTKAFKTTKFYQEVETGLNKRGYSITSIEFEKYTIEDIKTTPSIWVADIWLKANN